jgi:hypothetical protein
MSTITISTAEASLLYRKLWISECIIATPPVWINFGGILSVPCDLYLTEKLAEF